MPERSIGELIAASSLGTPEAVALRASVSAEQVTTVLARVRALEAGCTMTHAEHLATWKSWRDDCQGCGFGMQDLDQCERGHPDDGVEWCGACGWDVEYNRLGVGELDAIGEKSRAAGVDLTGWSLGREIREFALTLDERRTLYRRLLDEHNQQRARRGWPRNEHLSGWQKRCRVCDEWLPVEVTIERGKLAHEVCEVNR